MGRNVVNLPVIALSEAAQVFFRVGPLVGDAEVPVFAAASGGSALTQPILSGADGGYSVYFGDYDGDVWVHYGANTPFNSSVYRTELTTARGYVSKGSYEPTYLNESTPSGGVVEGTYVFSYNVDGGNMHSAVFTAVDCDLSWSNLPPTLNRGSMGLNTTTGATLPSTLGGSASPDWQVELLSMLVINSSQTFELWVDDGSTVRIQEYKYSGQA